MDSNGRPEPYTDNLVFKKLEFTVKSLTEGEKTKFPLNEEPLYFYKTLISGTIELLELVLGPSKTQNTEELGDNFQEIPNEYRNVILNSCGCMVSTLRNCYEQDLEFDPNTNGEIDRFVNLIADYLGTACSDSANGPYKLEFVSKVVGELPTDDFQQKFLKKLLSLIKSSLFRLCTAERLPRDGTFDSIRLIDAIFIYVHLLDSLLRVMHTIREDSLLKLRSFYRIIWKYLPHSKYYKMYILARRIVDQADLLFKETGTDTPIPPVKQTIKDKI